MNLRPYQTACIQAIQQAARKGIRRQLVVLPTGSGKTVVFAKLASLVAPGRRVLVLAHRDELLSQAQAKMQTANPGVTVGLEQAEHLAGDARIVVASVPTLGRGGRRLEQFDPAEFGMVITDEAHHATASTYQRLFQHFRAGEPDGPYLIGLTATPGRSDGIGLSAVFEEVVYERHLRQLMEVDPLDPGSPYLSPIRAWRVQTETDLAHIHTCTGDFVTAELADAANNPTRNRLAVDCYNERATGKRALIFCVDVQHARDMAEEFGRASIPSACIVGETPTEERRDTLAAFRAGEVLALTSCGVLCEGFDEPLVECIVMARPTQSSLLYMQMLGRGTRTAPGKEYLAVIDLVDVTRKALPSTSSLLGLPPAWEANGEDVLETVRRLEAIAEQCPEAARQAVSIEDARLLMREVDLLGDPDERAELERLSRFAWVVLPDGILCLSSQQARVRIRQDLLDQWHVTITEEGQTVQIATFATRAEAMAASDEYVTRYYPEVGRLLDHTAPWRFAPASPAQVDWLKRHGHWRPGVTKGEASQMMTQYFSRPRSGKQTSKPARGGHHGTRR